MERLIAKMMPFLARMFLNIQEDNFSITTHNQCQYILIYIFLRDFKSHKIHHVPLSGHTMLVSLKIVET